jgi:hypothetical protein
MNTDADDFRWRYAELSDEGLLLINREDLVEVARQSYDQELEMRGLQARREFRRPHLSLRIAKLMAVGGFSFWIPDVLVHLVRGDKFGRWDVLLVSVVLPVTFLAGYRRAAKRFKDESCRSVVGALILGVWLFGGFLMVVGASFAGGGFATADTLQGAAILTLASAVPPFTFMMSAYDGSMLALLIVSVKALAIFLTGRSKSHQSPDAEH